MEYLLVDLVPVQRGFPPNVEGRYPSREEINKVINRHYPNLTLIEYAVVEIEKGVPIPPHYNVGLFMPGHLYTAVER